MHCALILYGTPKDPAAFDRHYAEVHIPLVRAMPHVVDFQINAAPAADAGGGEPPYVIAIIRYNNEADFAASFGSEAGQAAAADVATFATGGATVLTMQLRSAL